MVMDAANLDAILQEARACFLFEDAPEYLETLAQGLHRLGSDRAAALDYTAMMRAAHSIKGGVGDCPTYPCQPTGASARGFAGSASGRPQHRSSRGL
ncbi:Hpt domain-containing protein [Neosynechococcus sphagnicola]|uniref:Hpt domain-containing protein n=1 Tax=Neosynechococcus sphagnicola TaxID=1501145 RepID=UPI001EF9D49A|nr:Hpt domain-containing protein [Neosynechococcus sphagnicola]